MNPWTGGTVPFSFNPDGAIVGYYLDANNLIHSCRSAEVVNHDRPGRSRTAASTKHMSAPLR
jgi:hypothetical protein